MENLKKFIEEERSTAVEYGFRMLVRAAAAAHQKDSKKVEEITTVVRKRLEAAQALPVSRA